MPKIDRKAHLELRMNGELQAAEVYEQTGNLKYALMQVSLDWMDHEHLMAIQRRAVAREANGGTLPKATSPQTSEKPADDK